MPRDYYTGSNRAKLDAIVETHLDGWVTVGCVPPPWNGRDRDGYAERIPVGKDRYRPHNYALRLTAGDPPPDRPEAAHTCRMKACVNPAHLSWKSVKGNAQDRLRDGTQNRGENHGGAKLTADDVREMHRLRAEGWIQKDLGERFGIGQPQAGRILRGEKWAHLHPDYEDA